MDASAAPFLPNKLRAPPSVINLTISCASGCPGGAACRCITFLHLPSTTCGCEVCSAFTAKFTAVDPLPASRKACAPVIAAASCRTCTSCGDVKAQEEFASYWSGFYDCDYGEYGRPDLTCSSCLHGFGYTHNMQDAEGETFEEVPWWLERDTEVKSTNCGWCGDVSSLPTECFDSQAGYCCYYCIESRDLWWLDPEDDRCHDGGYSSTESCSEDDPNRDDGASGYDSDND